MRASIPGATVGLTGGGARVGEAPVGGYRAYTFSHGAGAVCAGRAAAVCGGQGTPELAPHSALPFPLP